MTHIREYNVGVPANVRINDDGTITIEFDLSEVAQDVADDPETLDRYTDRTIQHDTLIVSTLCDSVRNTHSLTIPA